MAAVAAAWIAMSAPLAAGAVPATPVIMVAPYSGTATTTGSSWTVNGCAHATVAAKPVFHAATGKGALSVRSSASAGCPPGSASSGSASADWYTAVPIAITHKNSVVSVVDQLTAWVSAHITSANCTITVNISTNYAYCDEYAYSSVYLYTYVEDLTSGTYWFGGTGSFFGFAQYAFYDKYCYNSTCYTYANSTGLANQRSATSLATINVTGAHPADSFALFWEASGYSYAVAAVYHATMTGARSASVVNVATNGNGATLSSITIT